MIFSGYYDPFETVGSFYSATQCHLPEDLLVLVVGAYQYCSHEGLLYSNPPQWSSVIHLQKRYTPSGVRDLC
jgi:hypothetical protein